MKALVRLTMHVNQFNAESEHCLGDVIGVELSDPKNPKLDPKTKKVIPTFGDKLLKATSKDGQAACERLTIDQVFGNAPVGKHLPKVYLTRKSALAHGYEQKEIDEAFKAMGKNQKDALERLERGEGRREAATRKALEAAEIEQAGNASLLAQAAQSGAPA